MAGHEYGRGIVGTRYQVIEYKWFLMSGWSDINIIMVIQKQNLEKALLKVS